MQLFLSETVGLFLFILMTSTAGEVCRGPVCEFQLVVSLKQAMTTKIEDVTFNVGLNGTRLQVIENSIRIVADYSTIIGRTVNPDDVITVDGYTRDVIVINDQFPGPTIEVMEGVQVGYDECFKNSPLSVSWPDIILGGRGRKQRPGKQVKELRRRTD